jgi:tetratricopeptide (TPR) repeat protein
MTRRYSMGRPTMLAAALALATALASSARAQADRPETILALRRLLVAHDFAQLDSTLTERLQQSRSAPGNESRYVYAFDAFSTKDSTYRPHFDAWVTARPASTHALVARGAFFIDMAWRDRGEKWARETPDVQVERMYAWLRLAAADIVAAIRMEPTNMMPYTEGSEAARMTGDGEAERRFVTRALAIDSANFTVRLAHLEALRPRWGGSNEELDLFADDAQRLAVANPRLPVLLGFRAAERARDLHEDDQYEAALAEYDTALSHGDFWRYRVGRGLTLRMLERPERALVDFNRAVAQRPGNADALAWRAVAYADLARIEEGEARERLLQRAHEDLRIARELDPTEHTISWAMTHYPELGRAGAP